MNTFIRYIGTIFLLIICLRANGQEPFFRQHIISETYKDAKVNLMYEAKSGFIWFGTTEGVFQYDGINFTRFLAPGSLTDNHVTAIYEDKDQILWVGYENGTIFFMDHQMTLTEWTIEEGHPVVPITGFLQGEDGTFWFSTYGEGVYFHRNNRLYNINDDDDLLGNDIYQIAKDSQERIWAATDGGISICRVSENNDKQILNITKEDGLPDVIVRSLLMDGKGKCWIGTYGEGICYIDTKSRKVHHSLPDWTYGIINNLELFENRELWIGTEGNGLLRYDFQTEKIFPINNQGNLKGAKIYDLHKDVEGNIWVISNTNGICSANRQFEIIQNRLDNIQAVLSTKDGQLWVGTQTGLFTYMEEEGKFKRQLPELPLNVISLYESKRGNIWVGTFGEGVYCLSSEKKTIRHLTEKDGLTNGSILSIDGVNGHIWLATLGGVTEITGQLYGPSDGPLSIRNFNQESGLGTNFIYKVFIDSKGRVWFGTDGEGVSVLENDKITNYEEVDSIPLRAIYSITEDKRGHIWISTAREGIFEFDGERFTHLTVKEGIRDLAITSLITDANGNILIIHPSGIDILDPETKHLIYYDEEVGIENIEPNLNAVCKDDKGNIWIGTQEQVVRYTALDEELCIHPRTQLSTVSIFLDPVDFNKENVFNYNQNNLIFEYVGLWYSDPQKVKYRYMLEGFDLDWIISRDRQAIYSNLPHGKYSFKVTSTENDVFDQEPVQVYSFEIKAPIWRRPWFIILFTLLTLGVTYWVIKGREDRLQRETLLKKEKVESQFEALKSQINPHFLFNSFNTLITIIEENPNLAVEYVEKLSDFYRSILQYREKELIDLKEEIELVKHYGFLLQKRYGDNFQMEVPKPKGESILVVPLTLQILVENAVKHNVISKSRPLKVNVHLEDEGYISVVNNLQKKFTQTTSTGFGLHSIITRYAMLNDKKVKVRETEDQFIVSLPAIKNNEE